mmetsp:Transcript_131603/g.242115  ORF Transcript_131603/g.242115 Transcript_131603/m.242115 type:complete len:282 (-) Transcript_131603:181-1026(-)
MTANLVYWFMVAIKKAALASCTTHIFRKDRPSTILCRIIEFRSQYYITSGMAKLSANNLCVCRVKSEVTNCAPCINNISAAQRIIIGFANFKATLAEGSSIRQPNTCNGPTTHFCTCDSHILRMPTILFPKARKCTVLQLTLVSHAIHFIHPNWLAVRASCILGASKDTTSALGISYLHACHTSIRSIKWSIIANCPPLIVVIHFQATAARRASSNKTQRSVHQIEASRGVVRLLSVCGTACATNRCNLIGRTCCHCSCYSLPVGSALIQRGLGAGARYVG